MPTNSPPPLTSILYKHGAGFLYAAYLAVCKRSQVAKIPAPNLFIVGFPRCGTSSFYTYLSQHSDIMTGKHKELAHFNYPHVSWYNQKIGMQYSLNYRYSFNNYTNQSYLLDATPSYIYYRDALLKIRDARPDAKIIILFRNPLDRIISSYYHRQNHPHRMVEANAPSLEQYISQIIDRWQNKAETESAEAESGPHYRLYLSSYIKNVYDIFNSGNILFCLLEDFVANPKNEFARVMKFLDMEQENLRLTEIHNQGNFNRQNIPISEACRKKFLSATTPDLQAIGKVTKKDLLRYYYAGINAE